MDVSYFRSNYLYNFNPWLGCDLLAFIRVYTSLCVKYGAFYIEKRTLKAKTFMQMTVKMHEW